MVVVLYMYADLELESRITWKYIVNDILVPIYCLVLISISFLLILF